MALEMQLTLFPALVREGPRGTGSSVRFEHGANGMFDNATVHYPPDLARAAQHPSLGMIESTARELFDSLITEILDLLNAL